jgi:coenzyme F420-reducing hydrogenase alpha subunit
MEERMMARDVKIDVHYLTRVEGHGDITVDVKAGELKDCRFKVIESARFFETMLRGRLIYEAQHVTSRICGICSCGHSLASLKAAERAIGVKPHEDTVLLRKLLLTSSRWTATSCTRTSWLRRISWASRASCRSSRRTDPSSTGRSG